MPRQSNFARAMRQQCMSLILLMALGSAGFAHADDESADPTHLRQQAANTAPLIESLFHEGLRRVSVPKEVLRSGAAPEDVQHRLFSASNAQLCVSIYAAFEPRPDRAYLFLSRSYAYSWNEQKGSEVPINGYRAYWQELDKTAGPGGTFRWEGNLWVTTFVEEMATHFQLPVEVFVDAVDQMDEIPEDLRVPFTGRIKWGVLVKADPADVPSR